VHGGGQAQREYDPELNSAAWERWRREWLRLHPLCEDCEAEGRVEPAVDLHHTQGRRLGGPLITGAVKGLCKPHHGRRTARGE
jgi:5-methylcytosine-specific restriction enzyme A